MAFIASNITASHVAIALLGLALIRFVVRLYTRLFSQPWKDIPGPFWAKVTRLWYLSKVMKGDFEMLNIELHRKYGPVVRIAPNQVTVDDVDAVEAIYGRGGFAKDPWYDASSNPDMWHRSLFCDRDVQRHAATRKIVNPMYSSNNFPQMEPQVHHCLDIFISKLTEFAKSQQAFDLQKWFECFAFDAIAMITINKRYGFLDDGKDRHDLLASLRTFLAYLAHVGIFPEIHPGLIRLLGLLPNPGLQHMLEFTKSRILEHQEKLKSSSSPDQTDFMTQSLRIHQERPDEYPLKGVADTCGVNLIAGYDTTAVTITAIIYHISKTPGIAARVSEEIHEAKLSGNLSQPATFNETLKLPYLQACIKEGLRIHPATGLPLPRLVPQGGATIAGQHLPEGTIVGINIWVAHRSQKVFGEDADVFRPERWLEAGEKLSLMNKYFLPFGYGPNTCVGKSIALMEISVTLAELLQRFTFTEAEPDKPLKTENYWFVKQKDLMYRVSLK